MVRDVCTVCNEQIFSKICSHCMTERVEFWLERRRMSLVKESKTVVRQFLDKQKRFNKMTCSACLFETESAVCQSCFKEMMLAWLTKKDKALAADFGSFKMVQSQKELYA